MDEKMLRTIIQEYFKQHENRMITKFGEIERSVQFMSDSFEEQKTKFEAIMEETKTLRVENNKLKERIRSLETRFDDLEVEKRANNILIDGVPKQAEQNIASTVNKILGAIKLQATVTECFRLGKNENGPILVKFDNKESKKEVLRKIKDLKGITVKKCKLEGADRKIYFNEDLPVNKRALFKKVRDVKKQNNYKAAYCKNGVIYLKKMTKTLQ
nr:unnamed protein product [Callosobruchus analis]